MGEEDQRKFFRLPWSVKVLWQKDTEAEEARHDGVATKDISAGGICLTLDREIKVGDILKLSIDLGGKKTIHARGKVMWIKAEYEAGVEFINMAGETRWEISRFIYDAHKSNL